MVSKNSFCEILQQSTSSPQAKALAFYTFKMPCLTVELYEVKYMKKKSTLPRKPTVLVVILPDSVHLKLQLKVKQQP